MGLQARSELVGSKKSLEGDRKRLGMIRKSTSSMHVSIKTHPMHASSHGICSAGNLEIRGVTVMHGALHGITLKSIGRFPSLILTDPPQQLGIDL